MADLSLVKNPPDRITPIISLPQRQARKIWSTDTEQDLTITHELPWTLWPYISRDYLLVSQIPENIEQALLLQLPVHNREHIKFVKGLPHRETAPFDATILASEEASVKTLYIGFAEFRDRLWVELRFIESKHRALKGEEPIKKAFRRMRYINTLMETTSEAIKYVEDSFPQFSEALRRAFTERLQTYRLDHALMMVHPFLKPFALKMPNYKTYDFIDLSTERPKVMSFDSEYHYDFSVIKTKDPNDPDLPPAPASDNTQWPPIPTQATFLSNLTVEDYWMPFVLTEWQVKTIQPQLPIWSSMHMRFTRTIPHKEFVPINPNISPIDLRNLYSNTYIFRDNLWIETKIIHAIATIRGSSIPFWKGQEMLWYAHYLIQRACQALAYMEELAEAIDARQAAAVASAMAATPAAPVTTPASTAALVIPTTPAAPSHESAVNTTAPGPAAPANESAIQSGAEPAVSTNESAPAPAGAPTGPNESAQAPLEATSTPAPPNPVEESRGSQAPAPAPAPAGLATSNESVVHPAVLAPQSVPAQANQAQGSAPPQASAPPGRCQCPGCRTTKQQITGVPNPGPQPFAGHIFQSLAEALRAMQATRTQQYGPNHPLQLLQGFLVTSSISIPDYEKKVTWGKRDEQGRWVFPSDGEPEIMDFCIPPVEPAT